MKALILGGTGTLGQELARQLLEQNVEVTVFSRCELKQKTMAGGLLGGQIRYILGDIRDPQALRAAMVGQYVVFHCAALKHVDTLEINPEESIKTNVIGTMNVADAAIAEKVRYVVFSSTDKAVFPVNAYGMSKGLSEKILLRRNRTQTTTQFSVFRWGNVVGSRGSVIPMFAQTLQTQGKAFITHPEMTRFWIRIEDAVRFMIARYRSADGVMIPPMKAARVTDVVASVIRVLRLKEAKIEMVGVRPGEKIHESISDLIHSDEAPRFDADELDALVQESLP
jgi:UDP-N-acetylglucosamine 4,6-dehydratase